MKNLSLNRRKQVFKALLLAMLVGTVTPMMAQSGIAGLTNATTELQKYYPLVKNIVMAIGGVVGLVGGIRVFNKWQHGDHDVNKEIVGWAGASIFLVLVPVFVGAFFGF